VYGCPGSLTEQAAFAGAVDLLRVPGIGQAVCTVAAEFASGWLDGASVSSNAFWHRLGVIGGVAGSLAWDAANLRGDLAVLRRVTPVGVTLPQVHHMWPGSAARRCLVVTPDVPG